MNKKRILVIEDQTEPSGLGGISECQLIVTFEPPQALAFLMGGANPFKHKYSQDNLRPDILLMHVNFFNQENGIELLDLMKKYYSLRSINVYLFGDAVKAPDPALLSKYNIASFLEFPVSIDTLSDLISETSSSSFNFNVEKKFWAAPVFFIRDHVKPLMHQAGGQKAALINSGNALIKTKALYVGASGLALASVATIPLVNDNTEVEPPAKQISVQPKIAESKPTLHIDSFPVVEKLPEPVAPKIRKTEPVLNETPQEIIEEPKPDTSATVKFRNDFKIQVMAESEEVSAGF